MPNVKGWEVVIILVLLLLLFGAKRLPDAARGLGRSLRIFKTETKGLRDGDSTDRADDRVTDAPEPAPAPPRELSSGVTDREPVTPRPAEHHTTER